jgi:hypothetical protein
MAPTSYMGPLIPVLVGLAEKISAGEGVTSERKC